MITNGKTLLFLPSEPIWIKSENGEVITEQPSEFLKGILNL